MGKTKKLFNHMREHELSAHWQEQEYLLYTLPRQRKLTTKNNNNDRTKNP
jgi:hypothetical protein